MQILPVKDTKPHHQAIGYRGPSGRLVPAGVPRVIKQGQGRVIQTEAFAMVTT